MASIRQMQIYLDTNRNATSAIPAHTAVNALALAASTAETMTIPTGAKWVVFAGTTDFYVAYDATATVPGDTTDGSAAELNPTARYIGHISSISVISAGTPIVTATFYS